MAVEPNIVHVQRIWDQAPTHQYPDITRFGDTWFVVCREASVFGSEGSGTVRVIRSDDEGHSWTSAAHFVSSRADSAAEQEAARIDLRDPKIAVNGRGELMVTAYDTNMKDAEQDWRHTLAWFSRDGERWSDCHLIGEPGSYLWRITWHQGRGYALAHGGDLYASTDDSGRTFERIGPSGCTGSESAIVFEQDDELDWLAYCLFRAGRTAQIGMARAPYTDWVWQTEAFPIGGPDMIGLPDGRLVAAVRLYDGCLPAPIGDPSYNRRTSLCWVDPDQGSLKEFLALPAGGRGHGYAGMAWHDERLWVVYFSAHEEKQSIYLAQVQL